MQGGGGVTQGDIESEGRSGVAGKKGSRRRCEVEFEWAEKERGSTTQAETEPWRCER